MKKLSLTGKKRRQQSCFSNTYSYIKISRRLKLNMNSLKTRPIIRWHLVVKPDCCPTALNQQQTVEQNVWEPQKNHYIYLYAYTYRYIYIYIFYSHFIYGLSFTRHNLKTERADGASATSQGYPPHPPSSRSTDPFNMLQQPPTKKQSRPLQRLHVNSDGF